MTTQPDNIDERIAQLAEQQQENHMQAMAELAELRVITQQQAETARQQAESIRSLATAFTEQARAYREFSRSLPDVVETARRSAQASEGAAYMAQRTLEAMRDLIEEMRQGRG